MFGHFRLPPSIISYHPFLFLSFSFSFLLFFFSLAWSLLLLFCWIYRWKCGFDRPVFRVYINHLQFHEMITPRPLLSLSLSLCDSCLDPPSQNSHSAIYCLRSCLCRDIPCRPFSVISCHEMTYFSLSLSASLCVDCTFVLLPHMIRKLPLHNYWKKESEICFPFNLSILFKPNCFPTPGSYD